MAFDTHSLEAYSLVATAPTPASSGTSLVVTSGQGALFHTGQNCTVWPSGAQPLTTNSEIVRITNISTDTLTITRTQEGSSARSIIVGDQIANTITPKVLTDIETTVWPIANGGTGNATGTATVNANLTGPITSVGNATSIASQTGTGSKFVVDTSPTIVTPTIVKNANPVMSLNGSPVWQYLGYAQITGNITTTSTTVTQATGLTATVTVPTGVTKVKITFQSEALAINGSPVGMHVSVWNGTVGSGTQVGGSQATAPGSSFQFQGTLIAIDTPSPGSVTYNIGWYVDANTGTLYAAAGTPAFILVECC